MESIRGTQRTESNANPQGESSTPPEGQAASTDPRFILERGIAELKHGRAEAAASLFEHLLMHKPNHGLALCNLTIARMRMQDWKAALEVSERYLARHPEDTTGHVRHAFCLRCLGRFKQALKVLGNVIERSPRSGSAWLELGRTEHEAGHPQRALEAYEQVLIIRPRAAEAHEAIGRLHLEMNRLERAEHHLRRAIACQTRPERRAEHLDALAELHLKHHKPESALETYLQADTLSRTDNPERLFEIGCLLIQCGRREEAGQLLPRLESVDADLARRLRQILSL